MLSKVQRCSHDTTANTADKHMLIPELLRRGTVVGFGIRLLGYVDFNGAELLLGLIPAALFDTLKELDIRATYCNLGPTAEGQQKLFVSDVMNFRYALIWQEVAVYNVDIKDIRK
ncbi:uncharacterized protein PV06_04612 [Exophiala oligosperma]|uniref:Uncharacterized protein n=2 Tax=Chaetothyriales TaxID=34395 RepID=A0A0D2DKQ7_9EURO|nr:uncharacterized protein PV06_04612 [Exophiala oligosperma]KAJ9638029.1 hypothetical protein H2204_004620 [Knufia peltigerae]KIW43518.1 hypothetical protein PV06_04612 [Exophiala oligosperma]